MGLGMKFLKQMLVDVWGRRDDDANWRRHTVPLNPKTVGSVLMLHLNEKLGDAVIDSLLVDALARHHPAIPVSVGTTKGFERYWGSHPHVREVVVFPPSKGRSALSRVPAAQRAGRAVRGRYDLVVSFESFAQPDHFALLRALAPKTLVGFDKNRFRLFDFSLDEGRLGVEARPIVGKIASIMRVLGDEIDVSCLRGHVPLGPKDAQAVQPILDCLPGGPRLLLHAYGSGPRKLLSPAVVARLVAQTREAGHAGPIWVGVPEGRQGDYEAALGEGVAVIGPTNSLFTLIALVAAMDLVIAPDTSIGHIAAALGKPQVVLFPGEANVPRVWRPLNERCAVLVAPPGRSIESIDPTEFALAARNLVT